MHTCILILTREPVNPLCLLGFCIFLRVKSTREEMAGPVRYSLPAAAVWREEATGKGITDAWLAEQLQPYRIWPGMIPARQVRLRAR